MLEHAINYTMLGFKVFPLHYVKEDGRCSCENPSCNSYGKHPMTTHGLLDATDNPAQIAKWWNKCPKANIGIRTGEESGIIVIDIDDMNQRPFIDLPKTVYSRTGSGGEHHFYAHPGGKVKTDKAVLPGVDSRADGGYVVAPPSNHVNGHYEWIEDPFSGMELSDAPQWWLETLNNKTSKSNYFGETGIVEDVTFKEGTRDDSLFRWACYIYKAAPIQYDVFRSLVIHQNLVACIPPLEEKQVDKIVQSVIRYKGMSQVEFQAMEGLDKVAANTLKRHAKQMAETFISDIGESDLDIPEFMPKDGLIKDIAEYILSRSEWPLPRLAIMAATCFVGALAGRKYCSWSGLGPNILVAGLADSGSGKNTPKSTILNIAREAKAIPVMGSTNLASSQGLLTEMSENPTKMYVFDEFGLFLQSLTGTNQNQSKRDIMREIMALYSAFHDIHLGTAYADNKKNPQKVIEHPCLIVYGVSTYEHFYKALTSDQGSDGFLGRFIIVPAEEFRSINADPEYSTIPENIIKKSTSILNFSPRDEHEKEIMLKVPCDDDTRRLFKELDIGLTEKMKTATDKSIYTRVKENAIKLAMIHAISRNYEMPNMGYEDFLWGSKIALFSAKFLLSEIEKNVADNDHERMVKKIQAKIRDSGKDGVNRDMLKRSFHNLKPRDRDEILEDLVNTKAIFEHDRRYYDAKWFSIVKGVAE